MNFYPKSQQLQLRLHILHSTEMITPYVLIILWSFDITNNWLIVTVDNSSSTAQITNATYDWLGWALSSKDSNSAEKWLLSSLRLFIIILRYRRNSEVTNIMGAWKCMFLGFLCMVSLPLSRPQVLDLDLSNFERVTQVASGHTTGDWLVKV